MKLFDQNSKHYTLQLAHNKEAFPMELILANTDQTL